MIAPVGQNNFVPPQQRVNSKENKPNSTAAETAVQESKETRTDETREPPVQRSAEVMQSLASQEKNQQNQVQEKKSTNMRNAIKAYQQQK